MRHLQRSRWLLGLMLLACLDTAALAAGDPGRGGDRFDEECGDCHSLKAGKNKKGPSLAGIVGRKSATVADFVYSDTLKAAGWVWTPERIDAYLKAPKAVVPAGRMKYEGLADAQARADIIAFLSEEK